MFLNQAWGRRRKRHEDLILAVLAAKPDGRFAYDMQKLTRIPSGALYIALARLERAGLVGATWQELTVDGDARCLYRLYWVTQDGREKAAQGPGLLLPAED